MDKQLGCEATGKPLVLLKGNSVVLIVDKFLGSKVIGNMLGFLKDNLLVLLVDKPLGSEVAGETMDPLECISGIWNQQATWIHSGG